MKVLHLRIEGFGKFVKPLEINFESEGVQVIFGPNESGKSTIMQALLAVLFGIPESAKDKFRPWHGNGFSTGSVTLEAAGRRLLIERDFATDIVGCALIENGREKPVFSDRDRAGARGERPYLKLLAEFLPINDYEVFQNTTFIGQEQLGVTVPASLKKLFTGTQETYFDEILNGSVEDYFRITSDGEPINRDNHTRPGVLEKYQKRYKEKKQILNDLKESFRGQTTIQEEIEQLESRLKELDKALGIEEQKMHALETLCDRIQEESQLKDTHNEIFEQRNVILRIEKEIEELQSRMESEFNNLQELQAEEVQDDVNRWLDLIMTRNQLEEELRQVARRREEIEEMMKAKYSIYSDYGPELISNLQKYSDLLQQREAAKEKIKEIDEVNFNLLKSGKTRKLTYYSIATVLSIAIAVALYWSDGLQTYALAAGLSVFMLAFAVIQLIVVQPARRELQNYEMQRQVKKNDISFMNSEIEKFEAKYYNIPKLANIVFHRDEYKKYEALKESQREWLAKEKFILGQLNSPEIQGKLFKLETK